MVSKSFHCKGCHIKMSYEIRTNKELTTLNTLCQKQKPWIQSPKPRKWFICFDIWIRVHFETPKNKTCHILDICITNVEDSNIFHSKYILVCWMILGKYKFSSGKTTWTAALYDCRTWGGNIATPTSKDENSQLLEMMKSRY